MSNVTFEVGGRKFTVACSDGEESHIEMLGQRIADKLAGIPDLTGQSEARTLLYAALLLADENHELESKAGASPAPADMPDIAEPLEKLAERLESLASHLESGASTS